ncbi:MAG: hypothetical protein HKN16_12745 [Saprospiraceae bacterium]|nr:hypothetical protein [Saprospiraceae bacterium]
MNDRLEKFISENREAFDDKMPSRELWDKIESQLPREAKVRKFNWRSLSIAATFLLLVGLVGFFAFQSGKQQGVAMTLAEVSPEYAEAEQYYQTEIQNKLVLLASHNPDEEITRDLSEMEAFMQELKIEFQNINTNEREIVVQEMIKNYRSRLDFLERVLEKLSTHSSPTKIEKNEYKNI